MMWDFGDGNTYTPGAADHQRPRSVAYAPQQQEPFMPLVGGMAVQSSPSTSSTSAYPPSPFAGGFAPPQQHYYPQAQQGQYAQQQQVPVPQRDVTTVTVEYGAQQYEAHTTHHSSRRHSHSHSHAHVRPHRTSNASRPQSAVIPGQHHQAQYVVPPVAPPTWKYSRCTGRKKALCIGVNYFRTREELKGCINDAVAVQRFLSDHGYKREDIVVLRDDVANPRQHPTRQNILDAMRWLVKDAQQDDSLFFHYSGHGSQIQDLDGDEVDGYDEVILPSDYKRAGVISDDTMHDIMVHPLPVGCRLTALFDSCHSGSALDLPYLYHSNGRVKGSQVAPRFRQRKSSPADVISFSGCMDSQTSADVVNGAGVASGAMSHAFIQSLSAHPRQTYVELLGSVRLILRARYKQKPQLSSSHRIDTGLQFVI